MEPTALDRVGSTDERRPYRTALQPTRRLFTAAEFHSMARDGYFDDQRVELIGGEILLMSSQSNLHGLGITFMSKELMRV